MVDSPKGGLFGGLKAAMHQTKRVLPGLLKVIFVLFMFSLS